MKPIDYKVVAKSKNLVVFFFLPPPPSLPPSLPPPPSLVIPLLYSILFTSLYSYDSYFFFFWLINLSNIFALILSVLMLSVCSSLVSKFCIDLLTSLYTFLLYDNKIRQNNYHHTYIKQVS